MAIAQRIQPKSWQVFRRLEAASQQKTWVKPLAWTVKYCASLLLAAIATDTAFLWTATGAIDAVVLAMMAFDGALIFGSPLQGVFLQRMSAAKNWVHQEKLNQLLLQNCQLETDRDSLLKQLKDYTKIFSGGTERDNDVLSLLKIKTATIDSLYLELVLNKKKLDQWDMELAELYLKMDKLSGVARRFVPIRQLGEGGMGSIFKVYDKTKNAMVVFKFIRSDMLNDENVLGRFKNEAEALQQAPAGYFVEFFEKGDLPAKDYCEITKTGLPESIQSVPYIEMEYISDATLEDIIRIERAIDPEKVLAIALCLAEGLEGLHKGKEGVGPLAHRDIKPANIFINIGESGLWSARLGDLGIVKTSEKTKKLTQTGTVTGTIAYCAPEVLMGQSRSTNDFIKADIYSLAVVVYEMLTGKLPRGQGLCEINELMLEIIKPKEPAPINVPGVSSELAQVVLKALSADANDRYQSMLEFHDALMTAMI